MKNLKQANFLLGCLAPLLFSCTPETDQTGTPSVSMQPPALLLTSRMVDPEQLFVRVTVGDQNVDMVAAGNGNWTGTIDLSPSTQHQFSVSWLENYSFNGEQRDLLLARALKTTEVTAGDNAAQVRFTSNEFNTSFDSDSDGRSNLSERNAGSEPFDSSSPSAPPSQVSIEVQLFIPDDLQAADKISDGLTMDAFVNSQTLELNRTGERWLGGRTLTENSEAFIDARLFSDNTRSVRLGAVRRSINVGNGGLIVIAADDFDFSFDDDGDSISNRQELINGSDPLDSNSPIPDPCQPTAFAPGCPTDTDDDGDTDFQETETADQDGDNIPDYLESNITDADDDTFTAQFDPDEMDPCVPSTESLACDM